MKGQRIVFPTPRLGNPITPTLNIVLSGNYMSYKVGDYVQVYYNLHKKCFSVCSRKGKVIGYTDQISLRDVKFFVSESGRKRVLKEKQKNVHAKVRGFVTNQTEPCGEEVRYNPYLFSSFVFSKTEEPVFEAEKVFLRGSSIWALVSK